jgi:hypothetical protein
VIADHIAFAAGANTSDRQDNGINGGDLSRDDGLQPDHDHRREHHRVDGGVRHRTVRAATVDRDAHAVGRREHRSAVSADVAGRRRKHMLSQGNIDGPNGIAQSIVDHAARPVTDFVGRLKQRERGPAPMLGCLGEQCGGAEKAGDVDIVPARVHDRHVVTGGVGGAYRAGIGKTGCLFDRQRIHVSTHQYRRSGAVAHDAADAGATDPAAHLVATVA